MYIVLIMMSQMRLNFIFDCLLFLSIVAVFGLNHQAPVFVFRRERGVCTEAEVLTGPKYL